MAGYLVGSYTRYRDKTAALPKMDLQPLLERYWHVIDCDIEIECRPTVKLVPKESDAGKV